MQGYNNGDGRSTSEDSGGFGDGTMGGNFGDSYVASPNHPPPSPPTSIGVQHQPMTPTAAGSITQFATPPSQSYYVPQPQYMPQQQQQLQQYQQQYHGHEPVVQMQMPYAQQRMMPHTQQRQYAQQPPVQQQEFTHQSQPVMQSPPVQSTYVPRETPPPQQPPPPPNGGGSFAARSAAAYAAAIKVTPLQPQVIMPSLPNKITQPVVANAVPSSTAPPFNDLPALQAQQNKILTDCTRKVQEHAYYMKQAMEKDDLPTVLERAVYMVEELGDGMSSQLTPKNYYELHMRALDDMPSLEEYFVAATSTGKHRMRDLYDQVQYCPRVLPRLYLQISAGSALIRSKEETAKWVLADLIDGVKCVQNPVRGLFLRHFLLQVTRDKLPDSEEIKDAYEFVLANFIEMNKLWVRIQHLPGDGKTKDQRKRRERERNELRILVGTNLVRLSQLEGLSSQIYGEQILPKILEQITVCSDPLAQAYLIDCIIQVFPDEYHIETLPILLAVCPKLRDKVNIRTILQSLMDRLANYYAEEELLDEVDMNQVKKSMAKDSFPMFEECVQKVFNARGPKLVAKEVIRLQTALLNFSLKCFPGNKEQVNRCLGVCEKFVRQANNVANNYSTDATSDTGISSLDEASVIEMEKMLSIPLDSLALKVLELDHYSVLLQLLPWENRRDVGIAMLRAMDIPGGSPQTVKQVEELFTIIAPVIRDEASSIVDEMGNMTMASPGLVDQAERWREVQEENTLVSKLVHLLDSEDDEVVFEMLSVARTHLSTGGPHRVGSTLIPVVFLALKLATRIHASDQRYFMESQVVKQNVVPMDKEEAPEDFAKSAVVEKVKERTEGVILTDMEEESEAPNNVASESEALEAPEETTNTEVTPERTIKTEGTTEKTTTTTTTTEIRLEEAIKTEVVPEETIKTDDIYLNFSKLAQVSSAKTLRKVFVFLQSTVALLAKVNPEVGVNLYIDIALAADNMAVIDKDKQSSKALMQIAIELMSQGILLHEDDIAEPKSQERSLVKIIGALIALQTLNGDEYERLITKAAQFSAKLVRKPEQCRMVTLCAHLFYPGESKSYQNPQRSLECLQRALKLADSSTSVSAGNVYLFVELLDHYVGFFEIENPVVTDAYISGLVALIREHLDTVVPVTAPDITAVSDAKAQFSEILQYIKRRKNASVTSERFCKITLES